MIVEEGGGVVMIETMAAMVVVVDAMITGMIHLVVVVVAWDLP